MIFFNVKEAREYLLKNGFVFTLRGKMRRTGRDIAAKGSRRKRTKLGKVNIEYLARVTQVHQLHGCYQHSGFDSPKTWFDRACKMNKYKLPLYLYKVTFLEAS